MKKRIIITALSVMLASSSIIPAYAALPEGAPAVDIETGTMQDIYNGLYAWADQYIEELKSIEDIKARYQRMIELCAANWEAVPDGRNDGLQLAISLHNEGKIGDEGVGYIVEYWADKTGTPCGKYWANYCGIDMYMPYLLIDGERRYSLTNTIRLYGMKDEYLLAPAGTCDIMERDLKGQIYSEGEVGGMTWTRFSSVKRKSKVYVYSGDMSVPNLIISKGNIDDYCTADTIFYKAVEGVFTPLTRDEAVALGYDGID